MNPVKTVRQRNTKTARRNFLKTCGSLLPLFFLQPVLAGQRAPVTASSPLDEAIAHELGGGMAAIRPSAQISLAVPDIAEDGAIVPITVESTLNDVKSLLIFVEKNPFPLTARFNFRADMAPYVSLHIKMNESSDVIAIAETTDGGRYSAKKQVKVLQGGCG
jgi:sulfur-oxidizing protein SoxY